MDIVNNVNKDIYSNTVVVSLDFWHRGTNEYNWWIQPGTALSGTLISYNTYNTTITYSKIYARFGNLLTICIRQPGSAIGWDATCTSKLEPPYWFYTMFIENKPIGNIIFIYYFNNV